MIILHQCLPAYHQHGEVSLEADPSDASSPLMDGEDTGVADGNTYRDS